MENPNIFDPALLSFPDCEYLLEHAGEPPVIALRSIPAGANRKTLTEWIERFYELQELAKAGRETWKGVGAVKDAIKVYLRERAKWKAQEQLGAPALPSMYAFDTRGKGHFQAPGSDSGRVRTYFDENGNRVPFAVNLVGDGQLGWTPEWINKTSAPVQDKLIEDLEKCTFECSICHKTETFKAESRSSRAAARGRISKHLRNAETEKERHSELHTLEFNS